MENETMLKSIDEVAFHMRYFKIAEPRLIIKENINNMLEHGEPNGVLKINTGTEVIDGKYVKYTTFFNSTSECREMTWAKMKEHMMTFNTKEHSNIDDYEKNHLHHGFEFNMKYKIILHCGKVKITTTDCPEYPDKFFWIETQTEDAEFIPGWYLKVYSDELTDLIDEVLSSYIFPTSSDILMMYNGAEYEFEKKDINLEILDRKRYLNHNTYNTDKFYHDITFDESNNGELSVYWKLSIDGVWQKIPILIPNGRHTTGGIYLTDNEQMANETRCEVSKDVQRAIQEVVDNIINKHTAEIDKKSKLDDYNTYKTEFLNIMSPYLKVSKNMLNSKLFTDKELSNDDKECNLVRITEFYNKLYDLAKICGDRIPKWNAYYVKHESIGSMYHSRFSDILEEMGVDLLAIFKPFKIGYVVADGERGHNVTSSMIVKSSAKWLLYNDDEDELFKESYIEKVLVPLINDSDEIIPRKYRTLVSADELTLRSDVNSTDVVINSIEYLNIGYENNYGNEYFKIVENDYMEYFIPTNQYMPIITAEIDNAKFYLNSGEDNRTKKQVLYLYGSRDELLERDSVSGISHKLFMAFAKGISVGLKIMGIKTTAYPALFNDPRATDVCYIREHNIFALNLASFVRSKRKMSNVNLMMMKVAKAIANVEHTLKGLAFMIKVEHIFQTLNQKFYDGSKAIYWADEVKDFF